MRLNLTWSLYPFASAQPWSNNTPIHSVYFINRGVVSKIVEMADGKSVEVGIAGREHMTGLQLAVGLENLMHSLVVQVPGEGFRVEATTLKWALRSLPELAGILTRRLGIQSVQFERNAACNRFHGLKQRLAAISVVNL